MRSLAIFQSFISFDDFSPQPFSPSKESRQRIERKKETVIVFIFVRSRKQD